MLATEKQADPLHRLITTFGGHPCGQTWADLYLWELILNDRTDLCAILEIGSWQGGFSRYLFAQTAIRGMDFVTYDATEPDNSPPGFQRLDVFAEAQVVKDRLLSYDAPVALLCDGGNKPREVSLFTPFVPSSSLIIVHDWLTEFWPEDIPDRLEEKYVDVCEAVGSMSRVLEAA